MDEGVGMGPHIMAVDQNDTTRIVTQHEEVQEIVMNDWNFAGETMMQPMSPKPLMLN